MLLTSGQISMGISSSIVFLFTTILFYSGYFLQQRTVRDIRAVLHPPEPSPTALPSPAPAPLPRPFSPNAPDPAGAPQAVLAAPAPPGVLRARAAHAHIVRQPRDACAAAMLFAALARAGAPAPRLLLYPAAWTRAPPRAGGSAGAARTGRRLGTAMRLLRKSRDQYGAQLRAVPPLVEEEGASGGEGGVEDVERAYPSAGLLSLAGYERVLLLRAPGLVLDAGALDALFDAPMNRTILRFDDGTVEDQASGTQDGVAMLMHPDKDVYERVAREGVSTLDIGAVSEPESIIGKSILRTRALGTKAAVEYGPAAQVQGKTAYVHFDDADLPGPDFDVPASRLARARPVGEAGRMWDDLYAAYRALRMDACGLDLEPLALSGT